MVLRKETALQIKDLLKKNPHGLSISEIVRALRINRNTAGRYLENLLVSGQVEMRKFGMAKIYTPSQRVPLSAVLSISSELVVQLDKNLRIIFINEPFLDLIGTEEKDVLGKNIEYTPVALIFDEEFAGFIERIREGIAGKEWAGEIALNTKDIIVFCRIAPTVFEDGRRGVSVILEDITERKKGERALQESEATARALLNAPTDSVFLTDTRGVMLDLNDTAALRLKKPKADLIGILADTPLPEDVARLRRRMISQVLKTKQMVRFEDERDGTWFDTVAYPIIVDHGEVRRIAIISRDITERKKAEQALRESEERYKTLVDISPDAVIIHEEGKIIFLNPSALAIFGAKTTEEMVGKNVFDFIHPDFRNAIRKNIEKDLNGEITPPIELHMLRLDGKTIDVEGRGVKTTFSGRPAIQIAIRDITDHKHAEEELRIRERQLSSIYSNVPDKLFYLSLEPGNLFRFLTVNQSFLDSLHLPEDQVVGKCVDEVIHEPLFSRVREKCCRAILERKTIQWEEVRDYPVGKIFEDWHITAVFDERGHPTNLIGSIHDNTSHRLVEEALRASEERLRLLLDMTEDLIFMQDPEGRYLYFNAPARYGVSREMMIGSTPYDILDREAADKIVERVKNVAKTGRRIQEESPFVWKGQLLWFSDSLSPIENANGTITAVVTVSQNITERKRAEIALHENEQLCKRLLEQSFDAIDQFLGRDGGS